MADEGYCRWSEDNGKTWSKPVSVYNRNTPGRETSVDLPSGRFAKCWDYSAANPTNAERIHIGTVRTLPEGANPNTPQTYWRQTGMAYALSLDDGRSFGPALPLVKQGPEYSAEHPFDGLHHGKNQVYGIYEPLFLEDGRFLVPLELSVLEADGKTIYNPLGWDFSQIVVLIGKRAGEACVWDSSRPLRADYDTQSTRGLCEPTLARLADGRVLMVMRGSNHKKPEMPSHKWTSLSADGGKTWSPPAPWTYEDKEPFFSPSSISQMVAHSSGRLLLDRQYCPRQLRTPTATANAIRWSSARWTARPGCCCAVASPSSPTAGRTSTRTSSSRTSLASRTERPVKS